MEFLEALRHSPGLLIACAGLLGLCVGSLLNVVIHRLPKMMEAGWREECAALEGREPPPKITYNLFTPPSACPSCGTPIRAIHNIPVVSWLVLGGKCAKCRAPISARYPAVEILGGVVAALLAWRFGYSWELAFGLLFGWAMLALAFIDFDTQLLPDDLTLPLLWAGLVAAALGWTAVPLAQALWGAVAGYGSLWAVYWLFKLTTGKEGMGHGDFKLLAALGAWLGAPMVLPVVLAASILGAVVGIGMKMASRLVEGRYVPFGPFLAGAGLAVLLIGPPRVLDWLGWA